MLHAMGDMIAEDFFFHAPERGLDRRNLRHDIDAVTITVDHAGNTAHLAFDPAEATRARSLGRRLHSCYIPP